MTPLAPKEYWDLHFNEWVNKLEQAKQYCIIYVTDLTQKEMYNIYLVVYKYLCFMSTVPAYTNYQLQESEMITKRVDTSLYNITNGISWLAQKWAGNQQYLLTGDLHLIGEAPLEALSTRDINLELESSKTQREQEREETEQLEFTLSVDEDLEAARYKAEQRKYIFQQPPTVEPPPLEKTLEKGKQLQLQGYTQTPRDGNRTATKDSRQRQSKKGNPSLYSHTKRRTEVSKKAGRTQRPSDDDSDDDPNSEAKDAGRDADRSDLDNEPDKETAAEESDRSVSEITASMPEWERIPGQKQRSTSAKIDKHNKLANIRDTENCNGKAEECRDTITCDQYVQLIIKWLK